MSFRKAAYPALMPKFLAPPENTDHGDDEDDDDRDEQPDDLAAIEAALARRTRGRSS